MGDCVAGGSICASGTAESERPDSIWLEETGFDVVLTAAGDNKVNVIRHAVVEDEAHELREKLEAAGAGLELK